MKRPLLAISIGDAPEQAELGFGPEHLAEALVRLARQFLRADCDLSYGGDLRKGGFTELLLQLVRAENGNREELLRGGNPALRRSEQLRRLTNFLPWPKYGGLTADLHAQYLGVCTFVRVDLPKVPEPSTEADHLALDLLGKALALSEMRRVMTFGGIQDVDDHPTRAAAARVVLGGKVTGSTGFLPGIPEEVAWALEGTPKHPPLPVYVIGGFGGAAALLAKAFRAKSLPEELTLDYQRAADPALAERLRALERPRFQSISNRFHPRHRYDTLEKACREGVAGLAKRNGLGEKDNEILLESSEMARVLNVLEKVPKYLKDNPAPRRSPREPSPRERGPSDGPR